MTTEKIVVSNYSVEQTAQIVAEYKAGVSVEAIATAIGKTVRSVIAKLAKEGVYQSKAKVKGEARVTKAVLIDAIAASLNVTADRLESLEKANFEALDLVAKALAA